MSILLGFISASKIADLHIVAQQYFEDDEMFINCWGGLPDDKKCETIGEVLKEAIITDVKTDIELARAIAIFITQGSLDEYFEIKAEDENNYDIPIIAEKVIEEVKKEENKEVKQEVEKHNNGPRKPNANKFSKFVCDLCNCSMASHGSLYNHYNSKAHKISLMSAINKAKTLIDEYPSAVFFVNYRDPMNIPTLQKTETKLERLTKYEEYSKNKNDNPLINFKLVESRTSEKNLLL